MRQPPERIPSVMDEAQAKETLAREETYSGIRFYFFLIPHFEGYRTP